MHEGDKINPIKSFWNEFWLQLLVELAANALLVVLVLGTISLFTRITWRRHLRRFFGVRNARRGVVRILLSSIYIKEAGTLSLNHIRKGFFGYAHTEAEYHYGLRLAAVLQTRSLGRFVRALSEKIYESAVDRSISVQVTGSPGYIQRSPTGEQVVRRPDAYIRELLAEDQTLVLVGSPLYNSAVDFALENASKNCHFEFFRPDPGPDNIGYAIGVRPFGPNGHSEPFIRHKVRDESSRHNNYFHEYFLIQKISDQTLWKSRVIICAGTSTAATTAAVEKIQNWRELYKQFGVSPFAVLYELFTPDREVSLQDDHDRPDGWTVHEVWRYIG